jgi:hypothetical protein
MGWLSGKMQVSRVSGILRYLVSENEEGLAAGFEHIAAAKPGFLDGCPGAEAQPHFQALAAGVNSCPFKKEWPA